MRHEVDGEQRTALGDDNHRCQKADPDGASDDSDPFRGLKKTILCVVGQAEHEVAHEAARRQQDDPPSPLHAAVIDHAIEDEQEPEPRVSQGRGEGCRVDQVLERRPPGRTDRSGARASRRSRPRPSPSPQEGRRGGGIVRRQAGGRLPDLLWPHHVQAADRDGQHQDAAWRPARRRSEPTRHGARKH